MSGSESGRSIMRSASILTVISLAIKPINYLKDVVVAAFFGTTAGKDAFLVAWLIPDLVAKLVSEGLAFVLVPIFAEHLARDDEEGAWRVASSVGNLIVALMLGATILVIILAPLLVSILAPGFPPATHGLAVQLMRLLAASMVFMALAGLLMGVLNAYRRFVAPTLTPLAFNGVIIIGVIASGTTLGIQGLALASLLAAVSTVLIQIPRLPWDRLRYQARIYGHDPAVQRFAHLVGPLILGTLILNATGVIDRMVASGLPEGSLAALDFGLRTTGVAWVMVPALGTVLLPTLSALAAQREWEGFAVRLGSGLRVLILFLVPASALFILLAEPITRVLFQRGAFDVHSTRMTSGALAWYAAGLVSYGLYYLYITAFYALQNTMVRVRAGLILVSAYLVTVVALVHVMGVNALALGYGMGHTVAWLYLARTMQRRVPGVWGTVVPALPQIAAATVPMALAVFFLQAALHNPLMGSFLFTVGALVMVGGLAALVYGGTLWLLGNRDLRALPSLLAR